MENKNIERAAAEALLDAGLSLPLMSFHIPFRKKPIVVRVTLRRPFLGTQIRIARRFLRMGLRVEDIRELSKEQQMLFLMNHGEEVSRIVADTIWRGKAGGGLIGRATAWALRRWVEPDYMMMAFTRFALLSDISAFVSIISLTERMNPMTPRLSHTRKGS